MPVPQSTRSSFFLAALRVGKASLPAFMSGHSTRYDNIVFCLLVALVAIPVFGIVYAVLGDSTAAWSCAAATVCTAATGLLLADPARLSIARESLTFIIFALLLMLSFHVGGGRAPSVIWFAVCPMVAAAGGGVARGTWWLGAGLLAMLMMYIGDLLGIFPAPVVSDLFVLSFIGNAGFLLLVGAFMIFYELNHAAAIERLNEAMQRIEHMAKSDELTGILNRRELIRLAQQEGLRAGRYGHPLSFCLIDVDHFKSVNDTYGHRAGDEVLKQIAAEIGLMVRATDYFGRYGGEEFLLIMSGTGEAGALEFAGRIRAAVEHVDIPALPGVAVTISIGVAECAPGQTVDQGLDRADIALYRAKAAGRNRVEVHALASALPRSA
jgi:diguanylate cyclase (GGDEF)-like protein